MQPGRDGEHCPARALLLSSLVNLLRAKHQRFLGQRCFWCRRRDQASRGRSPGGSRVLPLLAACFGQMASALSPERCMPITPSSQPVVNIQRCWIWVKGWHRAQQAVPPFGGWQTRKALFRTGLAIGVGGKAGAHGWTPFHPGGGPWSALWP